jgi:hypothetical protein
MDNYKLVEVKNNFFVCVVMCTAVIWRVLMKSVGDVFYFLIESIPLCKVTIQALLITVKSQLSLRQ